MDGKDRVALMAWVWFVGLTFAGLGIGKFFGTPGTGAVWGFIFALIALFGWPYIMPPFLLRWMHDMHT